MPCSTIRLRAAPLAITTIVETSPAIAFAQAGADAIVRRDLLEQAERARRAGDHAAAIDRALRAMAIHATPSVHYFLAREYDLRLAAPRCARAGGRLRAGRRGRRDAPPPPPSVERAPRHAPYNVEDVLDRARRRTRRGRPREPAPRTRRRLRHRALRRASEPSPRALQARRRGRRGDSVRVEVRTFPKWWRASFSAWCCHHQAARARCDPSSAWCLPRAMRMCG